MVGIRLLEPHCDVSFVALGNAPAVHFYNVGQSAHGARGEGFIGGVQFSQREVSFPHGNPSFCSLIYDELSGQSWQAGMGKGRQQFTPAHQEEVGRIGFGQEATVIEHHRIVHTGDIGLDFSEDVVEQVVVVNVAVQKLGAIAPDRTGHKAYTLIAIDHPFIFRHHNQCWPMNVEPRVHSARGFASAAQGNAAMHAIAHAIGPQRFEYGLPHHAAFWNVGKGKGVCGGQQPVEVFFELYGFAISDAQSFPYRISALDNAVEHMDFGICP